MIGQPYSTLSEGNREAEYREASKKVPVAGLFTMLCSRCKQSRLIAGGKVVTRPKRKLVCKECLNARA
jgi:hypothetical protein